MKGRTLIGVFKDQSGSTTITVVLSLVLAIALMASCLQWYWVNTTSMDIQTVADMGALAAGEVVAQSVMVIQALDAFMLTLNLFGLLLHGIVLVSGTVVVVLGSEGGEVALEFFEKAVKYDKEFCDKRREIAREVKLFAETLNAVTPVLALARGALAVEQNQAHLGARNQSSYYGIIIPSPLVGTITMSNDPEDLEALEDTIRDASTQNKESAQKVKDLEAEIEAAIDRCFALDTYKNPQTARAFWNPAYSLPDFRTEWVRVKMRSAQPPDDPVPIDDTPSTRAQAAARYRDSYTRLGEYFEAMVLEAIGPDPLGDAPMAPSQVSLDELTRNEWDQAVLLLDHADGERKAYHARADCFGLSNASSELNQVMLRSLRGQYDHPPCTWCSPPPWRALQALEDDIAPFIAQWNLEADAILDYERLRQQAEEEITTAKTRTFEMLRELIEKAGEYLGGSRLTYEPSGGRGLWCVVVNTSSRTLPDYTLPALTGADEVELGGQIAIAGTRLMPSASETTLPSFLHEASATEAASEGLGGVARSLMGDDIVIVSFGLALWGSCLDLYNHQVSGVYRYAEGLPWGLGPMVENALDTILETAQVSVPDMRRPVPTLVPAKEVGDPASGGPEASLTQIFQSGRTLLEETGGLSTYGIKEQIRQTAESFIAQVSDLAGETLFPTIGGVTLRIPFLEEVLSSLGSRAFDVGIEALYQLPDVTW